MLNVENLSVSFRTRNGVVQAVKNVSFSLEQGKTLAIVGESGSGKSVTCYSLLGLTPMPPGHIDGGKALFHNRDLLSMTNRELRGIRGHRISMIFQDPMTSLNPYIRIGDQIIESLRVHQKLTKSEARKKAEAALTEVGIDAAQYRLNSFPHEFSGGMRQRVMIAMALATEPELLIADEPTTALDVTIQAQILGLLEDIQRKRNLSIIFISHDLAVVRNIADSVIVMKDGRIVEHGDPQQIFSTPQHEYTKKLIEAIPTAAKPWANDPNSPLLLSVKNLVTRFEFSSGPMWKKRISSVTAVDNISLNIRQGEILGLVGESGSGKSTFGRTVMRLVNAESGEASFDGINLLELEGAELKDARRHFQMIFQDPYASLNPRMTVFNILSEPMLLHNVADKSSIDAEVNKLMDDVGLERSAIRKYPHEFSGGQRQRIAIARALASKPKLIVADEPVSALDVTIQAQILELLLKLSKDRNLTMLFISHDLSVVRYLCDRVAVMQAGSLVELDDSENVFNNPQHKYTKQLLSAIPKMSA